MTPPKTPNATSDYLNLRKAPSAQGRNPTLDGRRMFELHQAFCRTRPELHGFFRYHYHEVAQRFLRADLLHTLLNHESICLSKKEKQLISRAFRHYRPDAGAKKALILLEADEKRWKEIRATILVRTKELLGERERFNSIFDRSKKEGTALDAYPYDMFSNPLIKIHYIADGTLDSSHMLQAAEIRQKT